MPVNLLTVSKGIGWMTYVFTGGLCYNGHYLPVTQLIQIMDLALGHFEVLQS